jgi:hypothetical protein
LSVLLDAVDAYEFETFFTGDAAGRLVLEHLRQFRVWWETCESGATPLSDRLGALFRGPADWPRAEPLTNHHLFAKIELPFERHIWIRETLRWLDEGRPWGNATFLFTYAPHSRTATINLYSSGRPQPSTLSHVASMLSTHCEASWLEGSRSDRNHRLWRSLARFGCCILRLLFVEGLEISVRPIAAGPSIALAAVSSNLPALATKIDEIAANCEALTERVEDTRRASELHSMATFVRTAQLSGPVLVLLGETRIYEGGRGKQVAEIDGVLLQMLGSEVRAHFLELKRSGSGARSQLLRLSRIACHPLGDISVMRTDAGSLTYRTLTWREAADDCAHRASRPS